jgi:hypothetical protein
MRFFPNRGEIMKKRILCAGIFFLFAMVCNAETERFSFGGTARFRYEFYRNAADLNEQIGTNDSYFRLRTSLWGKWNITDNNSLFIKLTGEPRWYLRENKPYQNQEFIFDNLYLDLKNIFFLPVDVRIGRQDLPYGEGFVLLEGTNGADGSRTIYFNAIKATWHLNEANSIDFGYLETCMKDHFFVINDQKLNLGPSDENAFFIYGKIKPNAKLLVEPYYIRKTEESMTVKIGGTPVLVPELDLNTIGTRILYTSAPWKVRGECAVQFGEYADGTDREGLGAYFFATRTFDSLPLKPELEAGYIYLSGDDGTSSKRKEWNPLFARYPFYSDLYPILYVAETGIPWYSTNSGIFRLGVKLDLPAATTLTLRYNLLRANESTNIPAPILSNTGKTRGHLFQGTLKHTFNKYLDGTVHAEYFSPGNFYFPSADPAVFVRGEIAVKF